MICVCLRFGEKVISFQSRISSSIVLISLVSDYKAVLKVLLHLHLVVEFFKQASLLVGSTG